MRPLAPVTAARRSVTPECRSGCGAGLGGCARDGFGDRGRDRSVEHGGDYVVVAELRFGDDRRNRVSRGELHLVGDGRGASVESAAEDPREAENVVDLVGVVRATGRDDARVTRRLLRVDLRRRVGHREDHRVAVHPSQGLRLQQARARKADHQIHSVDHVRRAPEAPLGVRPVAETSLGFGHRAVEVVLPPV